MIGVGDGVGIDGICGEHLHLVGTFGNHHFIGMIGDTVNRTEYMFTKMVGEIPLEERNQLSVLVCIKQLIDRLADSSQLVIEDIL